MLLWPHGASQEAALRLVPTAQGLAQQADPAAQGLPQQAERSVGGGAFRLEVSAQARASWLKHKACQKAVQAHRTHGSLPRLFAQLVVAPRA